MAQPARTRRAVAGALVAVTLLGGAACSTQPESIRSYVPAHGATFDSGSIKGRGLALVAKGDGAALIGTVLAEGGDTLTGAEVEPLDAVGQAGRPVVLDLSDVEVPAGGAANLATEGVGLSGTRLQPGLTARLTLHFSRSGDVVATVPVIDAAHPDFTAVPMPSGTPTGR